MIDFILFLFVGALAGSLAGLLGVGGGVVVVPLLVFIFQTMGAIPDAAVMQLAAGTSLAAMIVTASMSAYKHYKKGNVDLSIVQRLLPGVIIGVILGALLSTQLHSDVLEVVLALVLIVMALYMAFIREPKPERTLPSRLWVNVVALAVGFKSGLLGLGGGAIIIPFLVFCNVPMRKASGAAACCTLPVAIVGTIAYAFLGSTAIQPIVNSVGFVYLPAFIGVAIGSVLCVPLGVNVGARVDTRILKIIFAAFLFLVAIKMFTAAI